jgi:protein involved in polysaccharide export with SLBB domain
LPSASVQWRSFGPRRGAQRLRPDHPDQGRHRDLPGERPRSRKRRAVAEIQLHDGDTIFVPRAESVYVFGHVKNPGAYGVQKNTTVLQALSLAGGVTENAAMNRIQVIRIENGSKKELKVKLTDEVRPEDTIMVPQRYF